jgi:type II secretory pathway pseudopilin PulG
MTSRLRRCRPGLTLLEAVVSMAILSFGIVAIYQLVGLGTDRAADVQREAQGSMLAQRVLSEVMIGDPEKPLATTGFSAFPSDEGLDNWQWSLDANEIATGVWNVQVSVKFDAGTGDATTIQLGQMVVDPATRGSNQDPPVLQGTPTTSSGSSSSSSGSSSSSASSSASSMTGSGGTKTGTTGSGSTKTGTTGSGSTTKTGTTGSSTKTGTGTSGTTGSGTSGTGSGKTGTSGAGSGSSTTGKGG